MLVYNKRRDFMAMLRPASNEAGYRALREEILERGVVGPKAYFVAELKSKDELVVKVKAIAPQDF